MILAQQAMSELLHLPSYSGPRGTLSVFENVFKGSVGLVELLINKTYVNPKLSGLMVSKQESSILVLAGTCTIICGAAPSLHQLNTPAECLVFEEQESFEIIDYSPNCIAVWLIKSM